MAPGGGEANSWSPKGETPLSLRRVHDTLLPFFLGLRLLEVDVVPPKVHAYP